VLEGGAQKRGTIEGKKGGWGEDTDLYRQGRKFWDRGGRARSKTTKKRIHLQLVRSTNLPAHSSAPTEGEGAQPDKPVRQEGEKKDRQGFHGLLKREQKKIRGGKRSKVRRAEIVNPPKEVWFRNRSNVGTKRGKKQNANWVSRSER